MTHVIIHEIDENFIHLTRDMEKIVFTFSYIKYASIQTLRLGCLNLKIALDAPIWSFNFSNNNNINRYDKKNPKTHLKLVIKMYNVYITY